MGRVPDSEFDNVDGTAGRTYLRNLFLAAISEGSPETLQGLLGKPLAAFRSCRGELDELGVPPTRPLSWFEIAYYEPAADLIEALTNWARGWHLEAEWCFDNALRTLQSWMTGQDLRFRTELYVTDVIIPLTPPEGLPVYRPGPGGMTRQMYLLWVREDAETAIINHSILKHAEASQRAAFIESIIAAARKYCDESEKALALPRSVEKRNLPKHVAWTVRFQVKGQTLEEVATDANVEESAVSQAVKDILRRIGLNSRTRGKRGRSSGSKTKDPRTSKIRRRLGR